MGYCTTCSEWCGYSTSNCENINCELTRKLIGLYGIDKVGECLAKVFVRDTNAISNRTNKVDDIKLVPDIKKYNLRKKNEID